MSWKSFACLAALGAMSAPALAVPSIGLVDNMDGTATLQVTATDNGSLAAEILIDATGGLGLTSATIADSVVWDTANPGANSLTGGETTGIYDAEIGNGDVFVSYGSDVVAPGTYDLLTLSYTGTGNLAASGLVAALGVNTTGLAADVDIDPVGGLFGDFEPDGDVDIIDFGNFADAFGSMTGDANYNVLADFEPDGDVDIIDFGEFADNFGIGVPATAVPEPTAALLGLIGVATLGLRRKV